MEIPLLGGQQQLPREGGASRDSQTSAHPTGPRPRTQSLRVGTLGLVPAREGGSRLSPRCWARAGLPDRVTSQDPACNQE